jgi:photosystem II reaction center protein PsbP
MKKYILGIIIILAVIFVSGCITDSNNGNNTNGTVNPTTLAKNGISIEYPGNWVVANSGANDSILAVADPKFEDSNTGLSSVNVNIERQNLSSSLISFFNQTYSKLFSNSSYTLLAQGNASVGQYKALECIYTQDANGSIKQHRALWIENNNEVYVILCTAPQDEFQNQANNFDFILSTFKIT